MPVPSVSRQYYRNYSLGDTIYTNHGYATDSLATYEEVGFPPPSGKQFKGWCETNDATTSIYNPGDTIVAGSIFTIWEPIRRSYYIASATDLTSIANAIRIKGGTSASLAFPDEFVSAINNIPTGDPNLKMNMINRTFTSFEDTECSTIGSAAFAYCEQLQSVSFSNCHTIFREAFLDCHSLTSAYFSKCNNILQSAFIRCYNLLSVSFPLVQVIPENAFCLCSSLNSIYFPECVKIQRAAFSGCRSLNTIAFSKCTEIGSDAFCQCSILSDVYLPQCTTVCSMAFAYCSALTEISLPKCQILYNQVFYKCINLVSLYLLGSSVVSLSASGAFMSTPIGGYSDAAGRFGSVYVPQSLLTAYHSATNWSIFSDRIVALGTGGSN